MAKQSLIGHPKTADLADRLDCDISDAVGLLECLFHFTGNYAANGLIGRWSDRAIVDGMKTRRPIQTVIQALAASGWILTAADEAEKLECECPGDHEKWYVHNWHVHAQTWVRAKLIDEGQTFFFGHAAERPRGRQPSQPTLPTQKSEPQSQDKPAAVNSKIENKSFTNDLETINKPESKADQKGISSRASLPSAKAIAKAKAKAIGSNQLTDGSGQPPGSALIQPNGKSPDGNRRRRFATEEDEIAFKRQQCEDIKRRQAEGGGT